MECRAETRNVQEESATEEELAYQKRSGFASTRGQDYEVGLLCMFFLRALRYASDFFLASNHDDAGKFDDLVLIYRLKRDQGHGYRAILLQAKHKSKVTEEELSSIFPFRLKEYLESFKNIRSQWEQPFMVGNREIRCQEIVLVLYTNAICAIGESAVDITENPEMLHLQNLLNTGGRLLRISEAQRVKLPQGEETSHFLEGMILCTEQVCVEEVDSFLEEELCKILNLSSELAKNLNSEFKRVMKEWWSEEGRARYLTAECREWCKVLDLEVRRLNGDTVNIDRILNLDFNEVALQRFSVYCRFANLSWICVSDEYQAKAVRSRLLRAKSNSLVIDAESLISVLNEITLLWGHVVCPTLVVDMSAVSPVESSLMLDIQYCLQEAARSEARRQLVVIARGKSPSGDWNEVAVESTWSVLHQDTRDRLLATRVRLQGKAVVMRDIVSSYATDVMTDKVINWLCDCETELKLGAPMPAPLEFYVPRCLERSSFNTITVDRLMNTSTLLFSYTYISSNNEFTGRFNTLYPFEIDTIKEIKDPIIVERVNNDYDIRQLCTRFCVKGISGEFSMEGIQGNVKEFIPFTYNGEEKIVIIEGPPGVGKSSFVTMMCSRVKDQFPETWVLRLDMGRHTDYIKDTTFTEVNNIKEFLLMSLPTEDNNLERHILEQSISVTGNVFLFLDAFDEISPDFTTKCSVLLKGIAQTIRYRQMVVTTRPVTTRDVEEALRTKAFILPVFCREEQNLFLKHFSETKGKKVSEEEISFLHQSVGTILEIPLLCRMAADVLLHSREQRILQFVNPWRRVLLYELFVEQSVKERVAEKLELDTSKPGSKMLLDSHKSSHLQNLQGLGVRKLMPLDRIPRHLVSTVTPEEKLGLVVNSGDSVDFEHQTFAEYFLGCWLACHWQKCRRTVLRDVLLQDGFQFVAATFSWSLFDRGCPLHVAVARGDADAVRRELVSAGTTDRGGRSALHVAAMTHGDHREVWELLMASRDDLNRKENVLGTTAVKYAECCANWELVNVLLEKIGIGQYNVLRNKATKVLDYLGLKKRTNIDDQKLFTAQETTKDVLMYALKKDLARLFQAIWSQHSNLFENESLLHIAAANNSKQVMKVLLKIHNELDVINENRFTPLQEGSRNGHVEVVALLVKSGADLNIKTEDGDTALTLAARKGHLEVVKLLLEKGADINIKTMFGHTALTKAASGGHLEVVKILLKNGADLNVKTEGGDTALTLAATGGHLQVVKMLFQKRADLNIKTMFGHTALTKAASLGHLDVVRMLLDKGADLNIKTKSGLTALMEAASGGHLKVVKMLLENGADLTIRTEGGDTALTLAAIEGHLGVIKTLFQKGAEVGDTALTLAASRGHLEVVKMLLDYGAGLNIKIKGGKTALTEAASAGHLEVVKTLLDNGVDLNVKIEDGDSALTKAASGGHLELVKMLLDNGADLNIKTEGGHTALTEAAREGHLDVVKMLSENGADVNIKTADGETALTWAAREGHLEVVKMLSENGADVNIKTADGETALTWAASRGHLEMVEILLKHGADLNEKTMIGHTALSRAASRCHLEVVKMLSEKEADLNIKAKGGHTALSWAASRGQLEVVKMLSEHGADLNVKTKGGHTALTEAASRGHLGVVKMLLEKGSDINIKTKGGHSPLTWAASRGHLEVVKILLENGADVNMTTMFGHTALSWAASRGHLEVVKMLLKKEANLNIKNKCGDTALMEAASGGHLEVVRVLFVSGADVNEINAKGESALKLAEKGHHLDVVSFFMKL